MQKINLSSEADTQTPLDEQTAVSQNLNSEHQLEPDLKLDMTKKSKKVLLIISLIAVISGSLTGVGGYQLKNKTSAGQSEEKITRVAEGEIKQGDVFGTKKTDNFKDNATGYLEAGGIDGEGSHSLLRPGGESQTVYLTSSVTDLDQLIGMEVKVWGETFKGQKAGWLMDVGRVEVIDPQAKAPVEAEL